MQEIKEKLKRRREAAEAKRRKLRRAMEDGDDEGVIEELFNLQMGEVGVIRCYMQLSLVVITVRCY